MLGLPSVYRCSSFMRESVHKDIGHVVLTDIRTSSLLLRQAVLAVIYNKASARPQQRTLGGFSDKINSVSQECDLSVGIL